MKDFFSFLKTRTFFKHFALAALSLALVLYICFKLLDVYTGHGDTVPVPDFKGKKISTLDHFVKDKEVQYQIIDSLYSPGEAPGVVLKQDPAPQTQVKHNRTVYLYVTSVLPPQIQMPKLVYASLRQALAMIESYGLKRGKIEEVSGDCDGCVLRMVVNGKVYTAEDFRQAEAAKKPLMIKKGTVVNLVIGSGASDERIVVPDVVGMTLEDAIRKLNNNGLTYGSIVSDAASKDSLKMWVYKQEPAATATGTIRLGSSIDMYITKDKSKVEGMPGDEDVDK